MKIFLTILAIVLALALVAGFLYFTRQDTPGEAPTDSQPAGITTFPTETDPEIPEYTIPQTETQPAGTEPQETRDNPQEATAAPGLDENETPHMEV